MGRVQQQGTRWVRARPVWWAAAVLMLAVLGSACSSSSGSDTDAGAGPDTRATTEPTSATEEVPVATIPTVPAGSVDCGSTSALAGWPTTTISGPDTYACIVDAAAAGTPAQMSAELVGDGQSGRATVAGHEVPTRRIVTWRVIGPGEVTKTTDRTEDGGTIETLTCTGLSRAGIQSPPAATACT